jgi:hypothetical protein
MTNEPDEVNSSYFRTPPPEEIVVHAGTPADTLRTWLAVPIPSRAGVLAAEA